MFVEVNSSTVVFQKNSHRKNTKEVAFCVANLQAEKNRKILDKGVVSPFSSLVNPKSRMAYFVPTVMRLQTD